MLIALLSITALFVLLLFVKSASNVEFCVVCGAVSGSWLALLMLYYAGYYSNQLIIALLIGQSIVGIMYRIKETLADRFAVFTLPYVLTATVVGYLLLATAAHTDAIVVLIAVWVAAGLLYVYRANERVKTTFDEVIACCRDW